MTKDEALKLALEALEYEAEKGNDDAYRVEREAIREALAQPEQERCEYCKRGLKTMCLCGMKAQPEQEPVAWMTITPYGEEDDIWYENPEGKLLDDWTYKPLYTTPPQPEPVIDKSAAIRIATSLGWEPKRTWQGLTDEERNNLWREVVGWGDPSHDDEDLMKAIEAKLKEKNT